VFEEAASSAPNKISDWMIRIAVALAFVLFGLDKFPSGPGTQWVEFFKEIGIGQWFRYFTGVVEVVGGVMVLYPGARRYGLAMLAVTMAVASAIHVLVMHHPANAIVTGVLCLGLVAAFMHSGQRAIR
jgi:uncharacterized membrane protein YphA (DoxX/SURF4 family)